MNSFTDQWGPSRSALTNSCKRKSDLDRDAHRDRRDGRDRCGKQEADHRGQCVAERIDDRIAVIIHRNGVSAIAVDDDRAILEDLRCGFK